MVKFADKSKKRDVLRNSSKLKTTANEDCKKVSISRDLTQQQREQDKKSRNDIKEEFERRVNNGETDIELKGRRIVHKKDLVSDAAGEERSATAGTPGPF